VLAADIRKFVHQTCQRDENVFGSSFFHQHLSVVADCATTLAERLGADMEVVKLAAYLHDISAVFDPATTPNHPKQSADLATQILLENGYSEVRTSNVAHAIASHSHPLPIGRVPIEDVCVSNADAAARILRPAYWMYFVFGIRKYAFEEGRQWLRELIEKQWCVLIEPAKELVGNQYAATVEFLAR
jgi:putative nucleotidyltransferase with HDIG domain